MQESLKLLEDDEYVSGNRACDDKVTNLDIFWIHPNFVNLFKTFPFVLIIDLTYKTNKYGLSLLEIIGVTSTEMTYLDDFSFLESEKNG